MSERAEDRAERNDGYQGENRADNPDHDDIEIAFAMRGSADGEKGDRDHGPVVGQISLSDLASRLCSADSFSFTLWP